MKKRSSRKKGGRKTIKVTFKVKGGKVLEKALEKKMHRFLDAWKTHIRDELEVHKQLLAQKHDFDKHLSETIRIHRQFVEELKKL